MKDLKIQCEDVNITTSYHDTYITLDLANPDLTFLADIKIESLIKGCLDVLPELFEAIIDYSEGELLEEYLAKQEPKEKEPLFLEEQVGGDEPTNDKILLIDADTIVYATASVMEEEKLHPNWPNENYEEPHYELDLEAAEAVIIEKLNYMKQRTGCQELQLYFTTSREHNFRYKVFPDYKVARKAVRHPAGIDLMKKHLIDKYENAFACVSYEADDVVVYLKTKEPEKYVLAAIDKDVLNATPGRHYNYNKDTFVETDTKTAKHWPYLQCIIGDPGDGIKGVPGIGEKRAANFIDTSMSEKDMWQGVVKAYESKSLTEDDAIITMQLVNMHQLRNKKIKLWKPSAIV
jgi:DNA polymerase-1